MNQLARRGQVALIEFLKRLRPGEIKKEPIKKWEPTRTKS
jgi:hypothetical protein